MRIICALLLISSLAAAETKLGKPLTLKAATPIDEILASPQKFLGKTVQVKGKVSAVCQHMGCWMNLADPKTGKSVRIKVDDGVIIFPMSARGKIATVEGFVEKLDLTHEEAVAYHKHLAEERGQKFNPASVKGAEASYRIRGTGSEIEGL